MPPIKTSINFGLVYIPVTLHNSSKPSGVSFNQLEKNSMSRVQYKKTCVDCNGREIAQEDIVKGFQYEKDKYVVFDDDEFERLKTQADKNITVQRFVDLSEIDPQYYEKHFYVNPSGNEKGFALFLHLLEHESKVAIAKTVLGNKEKLIAVRSKSGQMLLSTLFFYDEVQLNPAKELSAKAGSEEIKLGKMLLESMSGTFSPQEFKDEYGQRLKQAIEAKVAGRQIIEPKQKGAVQVADLMEALTASLKDGYIQGKKTGADADAHGKKTVRRPRVAV